MEKSIEQHLADFLSSQKRLGLTVYVKRCLNHIHATQGEKAARMVAQEIGEKWEPPSS